MRKTGKFEAQAMCFGAGRRKSFLFWPSAPCPGFHRHNFAFAAHLASPTLRADALRNARPTWRRCCGFQRFSTSRLKSMETRRAGAARHRAQAGSIGKTSRHLKQRRLHLEPTEPLRWPCKAATTAPSQAPGSTRETGPEGAGLFLHPADDIGRRSAMGRAN